DSWNGLNNQRNTVRTPELLRHLVGLGDGISREELRAISDPNLQGPCEACRPKPAGQNGRNQQPARRYGHDGISLRGSYRLAFAFIVVWIKSSPSSNPSSYFFALNASSILSLSLALSRSVKRRARVLLFSVICKCPGSLTMRM